eukprot:GHRR01018305.1.p1 GENE.GHRR01018305.1~~GHRR01018305.1.p1  ORF type:complete len:261 (+),score=51.42 GHRR01018305.1:126-908(+)
MTVLQICLHAPEPTGKIISCDLLLLPNANVNLHAILYIRLQSMHISKLTRHVLFVMLWCQGENAALSTSELLWYNALTSLPMLTLITAANGDFHIVAAAAATGMSMNGPLYFYFMVIAAATMGCLLNYSMFLCILHNSALSTTIVGVLRGVVTVLLGYVLDDVQFHVLNVLGLVLNTIGGVWYTYIKYMDKYCSGAKPTRSVVDSEKLSGSHKAAGAAANNDYSRRLQDMRDAVHFHAAEAGQLSMSSLDKLSQLNQYQQ